MTTKVELDDADRGLLEGKHGPAMQLAMRTVLRAADIMEATELVPVTFAHIDACFYNGQAHIDFARYLLDHGAKFAVPSWTNNGLAPLAGPSIHDEGTDPEMLEGSRVLMRLYEHLGCRPVWTCAPYQLPGRPELGDHIVVGESNAVTFYNSAIGARTNKYGDYLDVACALTGKAPFARLHTDEGRKGDLLFNTSGIPDSFKSSNFFHHLLGYHVGRISGTRIPVIAGLLPECSEDDLKAVSAAVAASGGVEMWHGIGITPEAPDADHAFGGKQPVETHDVTMADLRTALADLSRANDGPLAMVALGTPHFSLSEFEALVPHLVDQKISPQTRLYISTSRFIRDLAAQKGWIDALESAGATIITDSCTYYSPAVTGCSGRVMTNAAKWAYYAPGMLDVEVCFGSLKECAMSALRGEVWRDPELWSC